MEIERINDNTVKFYVTYVDIEERGFDRNEIWFNRERSEELFWEMMDEIHQEEEFIAEGPLWIQVQALEKGIEVIVTRAQLSKDGQKFEVPISENKKIDIPVDEKLDALLDHQMSNEKPDEEEGDLDDESLQFVVRFQDFEDLISLSHRIQLEEIKNEVYHFQGNYYLYVEFLEEHDETQDLDDILSIILEYGHESAVTNSRLEEYGKEIMKENALKQLKQYFSLR
ncbi:adaptor protein MecA [Metabacillus iocasae]|uniref:Adapter protein MecA n=1 Tax=Priestia iocasae TaxID=2291674 RepID=A0ABS2QV09_9BACI|nr:adaptor protein MecA [Metabacillus iocasae]MBM7702556.1 adapter protein MecA 1/2 [Metabacillus iocasae]